MKRLTCLFCALLLLLLPACGDTSGDPSASPSEPPVSTAPATPDPMPTPTPEPAFYHPLTGLPCENDLSGTRPVAIMLNNLREALPQQGNSQADIIYEVLAEGGITRMLAVYQEPGSLGLVGSVRSARQYYWEIAQGHDAVYIHAGASPEFYNTKSRLGLFTVDGVNGYYSSANAGMFWRNRERISGHRYAFEHSLLTSGEAITAMLAKEGKEAHKESYLYEMVFTDDGTPVQGSAATTVTVPFSNYKTGAGRVKVDLSSGPGFFACGGKIIPITWEKGAAENQLRYYDEDGSPLALGRGKTYVCITPASRTVMAE